MPKEENTDAFWDIEDLLPPRPKKAAIRRVLSDVTATEIELDTPAADDGFRIPPAGASEKRAPRSALREYDGSGLISHVKICPWPTVFEFYTKFCKDATRYFPLTHEPCEYVYFFSYMPQYEQMTVSQMSYYLYWRGEAKKENYLKTDINYLFLYIYEIINLPDLIPPAEGARTLSRLWKRYREEFRYLDKYLGEWLCDYCLIHGVSPDWEALDAFAGELAGKVSLPEFYLKNGEVSWELIAAISSYDYRKSKYYEAHAEKYDLHIPSSLVRAVNRVIMKHPEDFGICSITTSRDSYAGAIVSHRSKFKMEITRYALRKTCAGSEYDLKHIFANLIKLAENRVRMAVGIKSRFSPVIGDERLKREILDYFDEALPPLTVKPQKKESEEAYMLLYEPKQTGVADISRALDIEKQAWETAELLAVEDEAEETMPLASAPFEDTLSLPSAPTKDAVLPEILPQVCADADEGFGFVSSALNDSQRNALRAAIEGRFPDYCRGIGVMAEHMRGGINEISMEYIGDMMLESDFSVIEEYLEDLREALTLSADE
ncbi:MAG: TerB N-terminal domain-containing protein [Clostridia bacterium]|nr:TerB N-terminal domain-containing protein [Clostridia bacterium]